MKHLLAFIVIGLVLGILASSSALGSKAKTPIAAIIGGLVGAIAGGEIFRSALNPHTAIGKYGSLLVAVVLAAVLAWIGRSIGSRS